MLPNYLTHPHFEKALLNFSGDMLYYSITIVHLHTPDKGSKEAIKVVRFHGSVRRYIYKTTLFDLPLFFKAVKTNVDFQVVGSFMFERETAECIQEALCILKEENRQWTPSYFMTDYDEFEINAIENEFKHNLNKSSQMIVYHDNLKIVDLLI